MTIADRLCIDPTDPAELMMQAEEAEITAADMVLPADGMFGWDAIRAIGDFAARNPGKWRTIALKLSEPELSQTDIAGRLGISQATVARHLQALRII